MIGSDEESGILNKERPLFRKENSEALIHGDLRIVRFHLAEIGIQRHVKRQRIVGHKFGVQPRAVFKIVEKRGRGGGTRRIRLVQKMIAGQQPIGNELDIASGRHVFDSADRRELLRQSFHALRHVRPVVVFALAQDHAIKRDAPGLFRHHEKNAGS